MIRSCSGWPWLVGQNPALPILLLVIMALSLIASILFMAPIAQQSAGDVQVQKPQPTPVEVTAQVESAIEAKLITAPPSVEEQAPTTSVTRDETLGTTTFVISHPDGLRRIDWQTFRVLVDGHDATEWFFAQLRSPLTTVSFNPLMTSLSVTISGIPAGVQLRVWACLIGGPCSPVEVLLRDASGYPDSQFTNQQPLLPVWDDTGSVWEVSGVPHTTGQAQVATRFRGVVNDYLDGSMNGDWDNFTWTINVFVGDSQFPTAKDAFEANARFGNFVNNLPLTETHIDFNGDYYTTLIPSAPISLAAGTEYWFSVKAKRNLGGQPSSPSLRHSVQSGLTSDFIFGDSSIQALPYTNFGLYPGAVSLDIYGY